MLNWLRRRLSAEEGISLVEMLVAIVLVTIVLSALAATLATSLQAAVRNESRLRANALASELLEDLQAMRWEDLGFYAVDPDYRATFEGEPTVTPITAHADRSDHASRPMPLLDGPDRVLRDGVAYTVRTDIVWADDPATSATQDFMRFVVTVSWGDLDRARDVRNEATRAPVHSEQAASQFSIVEASVAPEIGYLSDSGAVVRAVGANGTSTATDKVSLRLVTSAPVTSVRVRFLERGASTETEVLLSGSQANTVWEATSPGWRFNNGDTDFRFEATYSGDTAAVVRPARLVHEAVSVVSGDPRTLTVVGGSRVATGWVCVDDLGRGREPIIVSAGFVGLTHDDAVEVGGAGLAAGTFAVFQEPTTSGAVFEHTIPVGHVWPATSATITTTGTRGFDGASATGSVPIEVRGPGEGGCP